MSRLFIAEKPELARAIVDGLDGGKRVGNYYQCGDDIVTWCIGHMLDLYEPGDFDERYKKWNLDDLPIKTPIRYRPKASTKEQLDTILMLIEQADTLVHAGDNDPEGQLIVDEILEYAGNTKPVKRFLTNDNNTKIVKKALANMKDNSEYYTLYQAALARSVADQRYGFNLSRLYTLLAQNKGYNGSLIVGRVLTPILGLIVRRDRANANHEKAYYYQVSGEFMFKGEAFTAKYVVPNDAPVDDKNRINDRDYASGIAQACNDQSAKIANTESRIKTESAPLPYNMLRLQADAANEFNYKPDKVMQITQDLRQKYRLITYNGSDCQYLNEEQHEDAPNVLEAIAKTVNDYGSVIEKTDASLKSRAFNNDNVTAHHAIIPTEASVNIDTLSEPEQNIYKLIAKRYIAQFYPKHEYSETVIQVSVGDHLFSTKSKQTLNNGWRVLFHQENDHDDDLSPLDLSYLAQHDEGRCTLANVIDKETKPPALYTMSTLLLDLTRVAKYMNDAKKKALLIEKDKDKKGENGGIGTPRTRDQRIMRLFELGFIKEDGKHIVSTDIGQGVIDALPVEVTAPDMTALWHEQQLLIEKGDITCNSFLEELWVFIEGQISAMTTGDLSITIPNGTDLEASCPKCGGELRTISGKSTRYVCGNCDFVLWGTIAGRKLSAKEVNTLLSKGSLKSRKGFMSKSKKKFEAGLTIDSSDNYKIKFVFEDKPKDTTPTKLEAPCPKCKGALKIVNGDKPRYYCGSCDFILWGKIAGRKLSVKEANTLITDGKLATVNGFISKKETQFSAGLTLNLEKNKVDFVFN